jgi:tetratricopeptide (TPR) repeat protein
VRFELWIAACALTVAACGSSTDGVVETPAVPLDTSGAQSTPEIASAQETGQAEGTPAAGASATTEAGASAQAPESTTKTKAAKVRTTNPKAKAALQAGISLAASSPQGALAKFKEALKEDSRLSAAHYNMGILYEQLGQYRDAESAYEDALEVQPDHYAAIENLANLALRKDEPGRAESILLGAIKKFPADLGLRNRLVSVWLAQKKLEAAETEAKKILKSDERNVRALVNLSIVFQRRGQLELASSVLERAREIDPGQAQIWVNLGFVYLAQSDKTKATEAFRRATEIRRDLPEAYNNLGALYVETRDYAGAIEALSRAISLYPDFAHAHANLGNAYKGNKQYKEAEASYKRAQSLDSSNVDVLYNLGILHLDNQLETVDRLARWDVVKDYLGKYLDRAQGLSEEEKERIAGFVAEADRGKVREQRAIEREERKKAQAAKKAAEGKSEPAPETPPGESRPDAEGAGTMPGEAKTEE